MNSARRALAAAACVGLILVATLPVGAQSGRRPPGRTSPAPPPEMAPLPTEVAPEQPLSTVSLPPTKIAAMRWVYDLNFPHTIADYVLAECATRLRSVKGLTVTSSSKDTNSKEASDLAKAATEEYVLWVRFALDAADSNKAEQGPPDLHNLVAEYVLMEPKTGKTKTRGRLYFQAYGARTGQGRILLPSYGRTGRGGNLTPDQCAEQMAQRVLESLGTTPSVTPGRTRG